MDVIQYRYAKSSKGGGIFKSPTDNDSSLSDATVVEQDQWDKPLKLDPNVDLVVAFGCRKLIKRDSVMVDLTTQFPSANIIGCTTSGEIAGTQIHDDSLIATAISFDNTKIQVKSADLADFDCLKTTATELVKQLSVDDLKYILVLSDGQLVNGTTLVSVLSELLPDDVLITGGLAGDTDQFTETEVWHNQSINPGKIVICGFYGDAISLSSGTFSGWKSFGPERLITKADGNKLYELDGQCALDLYKEYLGDYAAQLPASALRFPLSVRKADSEETIIRTILNIDEENQCLVFAGDTPEGSYAKLMRANIDNLIDGAQEAAELALQHSNQPPELGLLVSCVGRRLVLQQETEYELESIEEMLPQPCTLAGFYSYGEISPMSTGRRSVLHNQTMTITFMSESTNDA